MWLSSRRVKKGDRADSRPILSKRQHFAAVVLKNKKIPLIKQQNIRNEQKCWQKNVQNGGGKQKTNKQTNLNVHTQLISGTQEVENSTFQFYIVLTHFHAKKVIDVL